MNEIVKKTEDWEEKEILKFVLETLCDKGFITNKDKDKIYFQFIN